MGVRPSSTAGINVRILGEDEWQLHREVRLAALRDALEAFVAPFEGEGSYCDGFWRERMNGRWLLEPLSRFGIGGTTRRSPPQPQARPGHRCSSTNFDGVNR